MRWFLVSAALVVLGTVLLVSFASQAFNETHLKKFKALNACMACDLSKANLSEANLSGTDLSTATMREAYLDGAILCKTKMPWGEENSGCKIKD